MTKRQAAEVANVRLEQAQSALESKKKMMDILDTAIKHLSLLSQVGEAIAEVRIFAYYLNVCINNAILKAKLFCESHCKYNLHFT